jgi:hypothetical protein
MWACNFRSEGRRIECVLRRSSTGIRLKRLRADLGSVFHAVAHEAIFKRGHK